MYFYFVLMVAFVNLILKKMMMMMMMVLNSLILVWSCFRLVVCLVHQETYIPRLFGVTKFGLRNGRNKDARRNKDFIPE